jgi:hypothetical protein
MAKRKARGGGRKAKVVRRSTRRAKTARGSGPKPARRKKASTRPSKAPAAKARLAGTANTATGAARVRPARRRSAARLEAPVPTPPSSLDFGRGASAARTGRAEMAERERVHRTMSPAITGGDIDASVENAYFSGEEAPGGDNPTPDQDIVDDIGRSLGVQYQDAEELRPRDKVAERDKHRWELDPASSDDYKDRK